MGLVLKPKHEQTTSELGGKRLEERLLDSANAGCRRGADAAGRFALFVSACEARWRKRGRVAGFFHVFFGNYKAPSLSSRLQELIWNRGGF